MPEQIQTRLIEEEVKDSYLDYAMSVIIARALPDVRDGLKPVHRRILYSMHEMGLRYNKNFTKSARIVGDCFKYHPHGDSAIYDSLVRMAQDFSLRYPLVHGHGNFGCFTGDTKIKLLDGTSKSFNELCKIYKNDEVFYVYSINKRGNIVVGEAKNPRLTKKGTKIVELTLNTGEKIRCTPNHKFLLKNLKYKEAKDLTVNDSLIPGYLKISPIKGNTELNGYLMIKDSEDGKDKYVHEIADEYNLKNGIYSISDGQVRHHIDFNKFNNKPNNIIRTSWQKHTEIHNKHINERWQNKEFREKQYKGVKLFYKNNPEFVEKLRNRVIERNKNKDFIKKLSKIRKEVWKNKDLRQNLSNKIKRNFIEHPERKEFISNFSKEMWSNQTKREDIIKKLNIAIKSDVVRQKISIGIRNYIKNNPNILELKSKKLKEFYKRHPEIKKKISERSKALWTNENYRSKLINADYNHMSTMAKKAWGDEEYKLMQIEKAKNLWNNDDFRKKVTASVKRRNLQRLKENPGYMNKLASKAALTHNINWKNKEYKNKVIRSKVLFYVNRLISKIGEENINEENYNKNRFQNCFPQYDKAIEYFKDLNEMISLAKEYNHCIINIKSLDYKEDVYDITVNEYHNFLLDCGVFVHNSVEGYEPAHMRYSEAKLSKIAEEMLIDIDKETVDFVPNFDGSLQEPTILPAKLPNLLVNGSAGIAVGMATNIPPHNIAETVEAIIATISNPDITIEELMQHIKGPDFPTGSYILGYNGIKLAYKTGRGIITIRAKTEIKNNNIIITEIPYQTNKIALIENIAELVKEKRVEGISDIRDESDKRGMSIVIITKKDSNPEVVLNQLHKHSMLQTSFGIIMLALDKNQPKVLNLKQIIELYIRHRKDIVVRRTNFDLKKAEERSHILEGLRIALSNIDPIIKLIKASKDPAIAKESLMKSYKLSEKQSLAILDMRLQRLTSLEQNRIKEEYESLQKLIKELKDILASEQRILSIIKDELKALKQEFQDERRTKILDIEEEIETEDLIKKEDIVITATYSGYIKQTHLEEYRQQRRGGKGIIATETKEEDVVEHLFITSSHNYLLFFTNKGRVYWLKAYKLPIGSRYSKGKAIVNLIRLKEQDEKINTILPISKFSESDYLLFVTKKGTIKRTKLILFSKPRDGGKHAITLKDNDELENVRITPGNLDVIIGTKMGKAICFNEKDIRNMGRTASGVRAIRLRSNDEVIGLEIALKSASLLTITENGYGKRTSITEYRKIRRGGKGVLNIQCDERNGNVIGIKTVKDSDEIMLISKEGIMIRVPVNNISVIGRNTKGVRIMKLKDADKVKTIARVIMENS